MDNEIEKSEQPSHEDVLAAITSFNDPSIIVNIFRDLGWSYSIEIKETLALARQNANLSIKFKAIKHLRELLRGAAETSGYIANVSQTTPNAQGGSTTFSAKRISGILNPVKKIESTKIKESQNDAIQKQQTKETRTEPNRDSDRGQSKGEGQSCRPAGECSINSSSSSPGTDTRRAFPSGDAESGGIESPDGSETSRPVPREEINSRGKTASDSPNPCIKTRPPTCNQDLFPGIASAED